MADQLVAGLLQLQSNGEIFDCKGAFDYNLGRPKREAVIGSDRVHGFKETPQPGSIVGKITDRGSLDLNALVTGKGLTITLRLGNGKVIMLSNAWYSGDGNVNTEEAEIEVAWQGEGEEIS